MISILEFLVEKSNCSYSSVFGIKNMIGFDSLYGSASFRAEFSIDYIFEYLIFINKSVEYYIQK